MGLKQSKAHEGGEHYVMKSFIVFTKYYGNQIKEYIMGGANGMYAHSTLAGQP